MLNGKLPRTHRFHCPDEHALAAYVDQQLIGAERERVESHLAKCDSCLAQVGFLIKQSEIEVEPAPPSLVERAKKTETAERRMAPFGWRSVTWAAAAVGIMAVGLSVWREARPTPEEHSTMVATEQPPSAPVMGDTKNSAAETAVRNASPSESQPIVLSPQPGEVVHPSDFTVRWEPVANAVGYEVRVVTADGDLVWRQRVHENSANPPKQALKTGLKYFVWVRASLPSGKTEQSAAVSFIGG